MYGRNIQAARKARRLRQRELAAKCGVTREHLSRIERDQGSPTMGLLQRISKELGVTVSELTAAPDDEQKSDMQRRA